MTVYEQTICWDCQKATGGCSWSKSLTPVEGWEATLTPINITTTKDRKRDKAYAYRSAPGYKVKSCPEFVPDKPRKAVRHCIGSRR